MADDQGRRRDRPKPPSRPDPRGGPAAMLSALLVAGLIFAAAIMLHYGTLPAFLVPAAGLGEEATIEGQLTEGPASQNVTLVASVPAAAKVSEPKAKADRETQHLVTVAVKVKNESTATVGVAGPSQSLRTDRAHSYDSLTEDTVEVAAGKAKTVKLQFLVPKTEDPDTLTLKVAGEEHKFDVR